MKKILIFLILFWISLISLFLNWYTTTYVFPNTFLANKNISKMDISQLSQLIHNYTNATFHIQIKDRLYQYTYKDLGIEVDEEKTLQTIYKKNNAPFFQRLLAFFQSFQSQSLVLPVFTYSPEFDRFIEKTIFDVSQQTDTIVVDNTNICT
jgi:hypothetical protein